MLLQTQVYTHSHLQAHAQAHRTACSFSHKDKHTPLQAHAQAHRTAAAARRCACSHLLVNGWHAQREVQEGLCGGQHHRTVGNYQPILQRIQHVVHFRLRGRLVRRRQLDDLALAPVTELLRAQARICASVRVCVCACVCARARVRVCNSSEAPRVRSAPVAASCVHPPGSSLAGCCNQSLANTRKHTLHNFTQSEFKMSSNSYDTTCASHNLAQHVL